MDAEELSSTLSALGSMPRLTIVASLLAEPTHVSELARRLQMSRPLLYTHLNKLESAGLVGSRLEISSEGRSKKHYWVEPFSFTISAEAIQQAVQSPTEG